MSIISRRIEFLEEQSDQRNKQAMSEHDPCRREISRLNEELQMEKASRANIICKKNAEIAYFKTELDGLLSEIQTSASSQSGNKSHSPYLE